jgi:hypothetical protein
MLNTFSVTTFQPHVGQTFRLRLAESASVDLTLVEASPLGTDADTRRLRAPFRLIFRGSMGRAPRQAIYTIEHETLPPIEVFLVTISADATGVYLEAIFT